MPETSCAVFLVALALTAVEAAGIQRPRPQPRTAQTDTTAGADGAVETGAASASAPDAFTPAST